MIDLVCIVADKEMEAAVDGILRRPQALRTREFSFEILRHPRHDPGCFYAAQELLAGYREKAAHGLVLLDRAWDGVPKGTGRELEAQVEREWAPEIQAWAKTVVIDPELEVWVFSDSPHVAAVLNWPSDTADLRAALEGAGLWTADTPKPADPKAAVEWTRRRTRLARSSSLYRTLAARVSFDRCNDQSFERLVHLLRGWFAVPAPLPD